MRSEPVVPELNLQCKPAHNASLAYAVSLSSVMM